MDLSKYTAITADSRQCRPGCIFVAEKGTQVDGHRFIGAAIAAGAAAVVCEQLPADSDSYPQVDWLVVENSAIALGQMASEFYGNPSSKLTLIGVTGTNGKTTIATLLYHMATLSGQKAGLLSTVENRIADTVIPATHTTPDPVQLQQLLARMVEEGCTFCAMEVSSHAAHQHRIAGLTFAGGIFTNLTRDHLDYHKTFANYLAAKKSFFDMLPPSAFALANADDRNGAVMMQNTAASRHTFAVCNVADYMGKMEEDCLGAMIMDFDGQTSCPVHTAFTGAFNASNLTAVYAAWRILGHNFMDTCLLISMLQPVAGRMQTVTTGAGVTAVVDYAHTPDALENTLKALSESITPGADIITVVGCGGDRDAGKRPQMAAIACQLSTKVVITSDNPRSEDPAEIARQMMAGVPQEALPQVTVELDRAKAIAMALDMAKKGDAVLIAGKGHEDYQIIGSERHHFSDIEQVKLHS